jgi:hypothetical protein
MEVQQGVLSAPHQSGTGPCAGGPRMRRAYSHGHPQSPPGTHAAQPVRGTGGRPDAQVRACGGSLLSPAHLGQTAGPLPGHPSFCAVPTPSLLQLGPSRSRPIARVQSLTACDVGSPNSTEDCRRCSLRRSWNLLRARDAPDSALKSVHHGCMWRVRRTVSRTERRLCVCPPTSSCAADAAVEQRIVGDVSCG